VDEGGRGKEKGEKNRGKKKARLKKDLPYGAPKKRNKGEKKKKNTKTKEIRSKHQNRKGGGGEGPFICKGGGRFGEKGAHQAPKETTYSSIGKKKGKKKKQGWRL